MESFEELTRYGICKFNRYLSILLEEEEFEDEDKIFGM
jgi:hypothetical protein